MQKVIIERMTLKDIDGIMRIENASFKLPWKRQAFLNELSKNKLAVYLVAKLEGRVVGYAGMWKVLDEGHITNIAVHPDLRGQKIASAMVTELIRICRAATIQYLTLEVRQSNLIAQKLYLKHGFFISGARKAYYADNQEDAVIMWKEII